MSSRASWLATEIDRLLRLLDAKVAKDMGNDLTRLADRIEGRDEYSIGNDRRWRWTRRCRPSPSCDS
jgi:hypothetical protein